MSSDPNASPNRVQTYIERLRQESQRHAEQLVGEIEKLRALTASLEKEHDFLSEQSGRLTAELNEARRAHEECARLQNENGRLSGELRRATDLIEFYSGERGQLRVRLTEIELESARYASEYMNVEVQNTMLANLYVTIHRLHSTLDRQEVLDAIKEVIINLIGCEELAVFEREHDRLQLIASFGVDESSLASLPLDGGWIAGAVKDNEIFVRSADAEGSLAYENNLTACIPLRIGSDVTGAVAIFRLLQQKPGLETVDHELFDILSSHAAMALYTTTLHEAMQVEAEAV